MFPYNLQNYQPKKDPEEPIPDPILKRARDSGALFISKDGKIAYKEQMKVIECAFAPEFESWWYDPNLKLPEDVIDL
jgi:hypothetical protein